MPEHQVPELKIRQFEGPLDLLFHLIEKNDIDIYDIPIAEITDQYLVFLKDMDTLIHIKSRMLLPDRKAMQAAEEGEDLREELVIRLLQYRRCKTLAQELRGRYGQYSNCMTRLPSTPASLGIRIKDPPQEFDPDSFQKAITGVCARNEMRFADLSAKITHILKRDKVSVRDKMKIVWQKIVHSGRIFFHEIFPSQTTSKIEKIVGFMAVLELLRGNQITAEQERPFDVILLEKKKIQPEQESGLTSGNISGEGRGSAQYDG